MIDPSQMTTNAQRMALQGLPARLIQDGLLDEKTALQALEDSKAANTNLVAHLVTKGLADAREIAIAASQEFGVPLLDLDSIQPDLDIVRLVSDKLLQKHRVLPLGTRYRVGGSGVLIYRSFTDSPLTHNGLRTNCPGPHPLSVMAFRQ